MATDDLAEQIAHLIREQLAGPRKALPTYEEIARRYLAATHDRDKPSTRAHKRRTLELHVLPLIGTLAIDRVTREVLHELQGKLTAKGLKGTTVNLWIAKTRAVLAYAADELGLIAAVPRVRRLKGEHVPIVSTREAYEALLRADLDAETRAAVLLAGDSGLRCGEALALRWACVQGKTLHVCESMWNRGIITDTKSHKVRVVPATPRLWRTLERIRGTGRVLASIGSASYLHRLLRDEADGHEIERVTMHGLRHSYASELQRRGAPIVQIRDLLGHHSVAVTSTYLHATATDLAGAVLRLDDDHTP